MIRRTTIFLVSVIGIGALAAGFAVYHHSVRAARLDHAIPLAPYFPSGALWTQDISHAPLDPQSSAIVDWLADAGGWGNQNRMHVDFGFRVMEASPDSPLVPFRKGPGFLSPDSDSNVTTVPLPDGGGMEARPGYQCNAHADDCHLIVVDRSHKRLFEAWGANYANSELTAKFLGVWDLSRVYPPSGRGDQCTSADAAGFPIAPLLFTADELASGSVNHAIRFILPASRIRAHVFVHPATHAGGPSGPDLAPPMGVLFRLKASYDLSNLSPAARVVAQAMQKYGMYLADSGNIALTAQSDKDTKTKYADLGFDSHSLWGLQVTDFEVVKMGDPIRLTKNCARNR